jgi:hypothetical protein
VCFSPQADVGGGVLICAIGVDAVRHIRQRREFIALAWIPVLLGAHQRPASQPGTSVRSPDVRCQIRGQAQAAISGLRGYLGSEQSGLLARFMTRLLPCIRRSGPRRHID